MPGLTAQQASELANQFSQTHGRVISAFTGRVKSERSSHETLHQTVEDVLTAGDSTDITAALVALAELSSTLGNVYGASKIDPQFLQARRLYRGYFSGVDGALESAYVALGIERPHIY